MSIADKLQDLIDVKADMKSAIEEKGVTISGDLDSYADAIDQINTTSLIDKKYNALPKGIKISPRSYLVKLGIDNISLNDCLLSLNNRVVRTYNISDWTAINNLSAGGGWWVDCTNITDMREAFYGSGDLTNTQLNNTQKVTNFSKCFYSTKSSSDSNRIVQGTISFTNGEPNYYIDLEGCEDATGFLYKCENMYIYIKNLNCSIDIGRMSWIGDEPSPIDYMISNAKPVENATVRVYGYYVLRDSDIKALVSKGYTVEIYT